MKPIIFKPKVLSKAERAYMQALANRPRQTPFNELFGKMNKIAIEGETNG